MARRVLMTNVSGWREDGLGQVRDDGGGCATMCGRQEEWRAMVHVLMIEVLTPPFLLGPAFFRTSLPRSGGLSPWRKVVCIYKM